MVGSMMEAWFYDRRDSALTASVAELTAYCWRVFKTARVHHTRFIDHTCWQQDSREALQQHFVPWIYF